MAQAKKVREVLQDRTYNGWTNYETWAVALWLDNEEGTYRYWRRQAAISRKEDDPASNLAAILKAEAEDQMPELAGFYADLLNGALSEVDWYEIAKNMLEEE